MPAHAGASGAVAPWLRRRHPAFVALCWARQGTLPSMGAMDSFARLLERHPVVFFHLVTAAAALVLGLAIVLRRKGTPTHRGLGWAWVLLMASTAIASAFIRDYRLPNLYGYTPIHLFTVLTAVNLPLGIWFIRRGNVEGHRRTMRGLYICACVIAGLFTLLPGRFLGSLLWGTAMKGIAA